MTTLSVNDAARMAGVSRQSIHAQIGSGELNTSGQGIEVSELIRAYPSLKALANVKLRAVKKPINKYTPITRQRTSAAIEVKTLPRQEPTDVNEEKERQQARTVELLVRELEWNKELLEQTNQLMAKQLAEQRALIADQARRLDEKDRFWARQIEIAQSLLPAPAPAPRKKLFGIF